MRSFTSYLQKSVRPEWQDHYLDYVSLKSLLVKFANRRSKATQDMNITDIERFYPEVLDGSNSFDVNNRRFGRFGDFNLMSSASDDQSSVITKSETVKSYIAKIERDEFCFVLDKEIRKITSLYRQQLIDIKSDISLLENEIKTAIGSTASTCSTTCTTAAIEEDGGLLDTFLEKYKVIGKEVLELHAFVGANITALRQILIRYDSLIRTLDGPPLGQWYIVTRREVHVDSDFEAIFVRHGLMLLADTFAFALKNLQSNKKFLSDKHASAINDKIDKYLDGLNMDIGEMESVILRAERAVDKALRSRLALTDSIVYSLRYFFLAGSAMNELVMQPSFIRTRGLKLKQEIRFFAKWRTSQTLTSDADSNGNFRDLVQASLILNFISQFLYMMNHYIIEPSSTQYVHELGGKDALSGLLIGMTPWAGLISAFIYSYWSNQSFRQPLICSSICLTMGSFLYANALKFDSLTMAMVGRFMTGLGAPCGLNVRFIADTVKRANRTAISAILVTVSAMGMSLGPFFAVLLDYLDLDFYIPIFGEVTLNGMTGPGYLMFVLWGIYLVFLIIYFKEHERIGLLETAQLSKQYAAPTLGHTKSLDSVDTYEGTTLSGDEDDNLEVEDGSADNESTFAKLRYINEATIICLILKFIGKFVLEIIGCSVSLVTRHRYGWSVKNIGLLSFINGLLVIPISTSVGYLSQHYTDITMLYWLLGLALLGLCFLFDVTDFGANPFEDGYNDDLVLAVHPWRYVIGIVLEFCGYQAAQSVILSMLSKVVPLSLAKGTFNSGFMATIISSLARANGDVIITVMGLVSIRELLNLLVVPCILMTTFCLMISFFHTQKLSV